MRVPSRLLVTRPARQCLQVMRRVGEALGDLGREILDGAFALGEHVDNFGPPAAGERFGDRGERVEEGFLGFVLAHRHSQVYKQSLDKSGEVYSNSHLRS